MTIFKPWMNVLRYRVLIGPRLLPLSGHTSNGSHSPVGAASGFDWGSLIAAVIGAAMVIVGVVLAEVLTQRRELRQRIVAAMWELAAFAGAAFDSAAEFRELRDNRMSFMIALGKMLSEARWPLKDHKAIASELAAVMQRYEVAESERDGGKRTKDMLYVLGGLPDALGWVGRPVTNPDPD